MRVSATKGKIKSYKRQMLVESEKWIRNIYSVTGYSPTQINNK